MKIKLLAGLSMLVGLLSCSGENVIGGFNVDKEVVYNLAVEAPDMATTRLDGDDKSGKSSAFGAIDNADETFWANNDVRYILEVYEVGDDSNPVKQRMVNILPQYASTNFQFRLIPNREYRFVIFADFVAEGSTPSSDQANIGKHHTIGSTLNSINVKNDAINEEASDAYYISTKMVVENSTQKSLVLTRPYAKLRVVATDLADLNLNRNPKAIRVTYDEVYAKEFNAVTGKILGADAAKSDIFVDCYVDDLRHNMDKHHYTLDYDAMVNAAGNHTHMTLFTDYILAKDEQTEVHFTIEVFEDEAMTQLIKQTKFTTQIPIKRNNLTTVIGNVLTTGTSISVDVDDNFSNEQTVTQE